MVRRAAQHGLGVLLGRWEGHVAGRHQARLQHHAAATPAGTHHGSAHIERPSGAAAPPVMPTCDDPRLPLRPDVPYGRQAKGQGLARAGGGDADKIAPAQGDGQALGLDGGGVLEGARGVQLLGIQA